MPCLRARTRVAHDADDLLQKRRGRGRTEDCLSLESLLVVRNVDQDDGWRPMEYYRPLQCVHAKA